MGIMQDTNKNAIWIFAIVIVVLGLIWVFSSKSKSYKPSNNATTTAEVMDKSTDDSYTSSANEAVSPADNNGSALATPTLPKAGFGPKE